MRCAGRPVRYKGLGLSNSYWRKGRGRADHGRQYPYITAYRGIAGLRVDPLAIFRGYPLGHRVRNRVCARPSACAGIHAPAPQPRCPYDPAAYPDNRAADSDIDRHVSGAGGDDSL